MDSPSAPRSRAARTSFRFLVFILGLSAVAAASPAFAQQSATIETIAGGGPHDVPALETAIFPDDLAVDAAGNVYFPSRFRHRIYKVDTGGVLRLVAGTGIEHGLGDNGPIGRASFLLPDEIALMPSGDLLVYGGGDAYGCCNPDFDAWNRLDLQLRRIDFATGMVDHLTDFRGSILWPDDLIVASGGTIYAAHHFLFDELSGGNLGGVDEIDPSTGAAVRIAGAYVYSGPLDDGMPALDVSLQQVESIATVAGGDLLLSDLEHQRIRIIDLASGIIDSYAPASGLYGAIAFDGSGNLYVTSTSIVRRIDAVTGAVTVIAGTGTPGFSGDGGPATAAQIAAGSIAFDGSGNLFMAGDGRIRRVDHGTGIIQTVAGDPSADQYGDGGPATQALVRLPVDVAPDPSGDLYIAEAGYTAVRKVDGATGEITSLFRGAYGDTGVSNLSPPSLAAITLRQGILYYATESPITDIGPVTPSSVFMYDPGTGQKTRITGPNWIGCAGEGGPASSAALSSPRDLVFDAAGDLYIADSGNNQIRRIDAATGVITRVVGLTGATYCAAGGGFNGDGLQALDTQLNDPSGIALDSAGNLYIADTRNHRIRRVDAATGIVTTVAGNGGAGPAGDGGPAVQAQLNLPVRVEVDTAGNLYIVSGFSYQTDSGGQGVYSRGGKIRRVDAASGIISTFAGDGVLGFYGDGGPAAVAGLGGARGIAFDAAGNLLVASYEAGRVRKITLPVPPTATATATPAVLWPPSHQMVEIHVDVDTGATPGPLTIVLDSITSSEPDDAPGGSDGATVDDIQGADYGTEDYDFDLRAERSGSRGGRVYTITYVVTAASGLSVEATAFVMVPHDMGGIVDPVSLSIEERPSGSLLTWSEVPGANSYSIIRGDLGSLAELPDVIGLGDVSCIVFRTKGLTTAGAEDADVPGLGQGWFYLGEYHDPHASSYGSPFAPKPRSPADGACN